MRQAILLFGLGTAACGPQVTHTVSGRIQIQAGVRTDESVVGPLGGDLARWRFADVANIPEIASEGVTDVHALWVRLRLQEITPDGPRPVPLLPYIETFRLDTFSFLGPANIVHLDRFPNAPVVVESVDDLDLLKQMRRPGFKVGATLDLWRQRRRHPLELTVDLTVEVEGGAPLANTIAAI